MRDFNQQNNHTVAVAIFVSTVMLQKAIIVSRHRIAGRNGNRPSFLEREVAKS